MTLARLICILMSLLGSAALARTEHVQGTVIQVTDGDSLWLRPAAAEPRARPLEVRLQGIDAPEICQAWGPQARDALRGLLLGQAVNLKTTGRDTYGRTLGTLMLDGMNVNQWLVAEGHAWSARYKWDRGPYVKHERMASALGRGLHAGGGAVPPREFRAQHGPCPR